MKSQSVSKALSNLFIPVALTVTAITPTVPVRYRYRVASYYKGRLDPLILQTNLQVA